MHTEMKSDIPYTSGFARALELASSKKSNASVVRRLSNRSIDVPSLRQTDSSFDFERETLTGIGAGGYSYNVKADAAMKNGYYTSSLMHATSEVLRPQDNERFQRERRRGGSGGRMSAFAVDLRRINGQTLGKACEALFGHLSRDALV